MDKLIYLNHEMLKTPFEIERKTGVLAVDLIRLFEYNNVQFLKLPDIALRKRNRSFKNIYKLHVEKRLSLNEVYRESVFPLHIQKWYWVIRE